MNSSYIELSELLAQVSPVLRQGYLDPQGDSRNHSPIVSTDAGRRIAAADHSGPKAVPQATRVEKPVSPPPAISVESLPKVDVSGLDPAQAVDRINALVKNCSACGLCRTRNKTVPGTGSIHPVAMVIGEAPGADEDRIGLPFVGAAGQFLDKWLEAIGLSRYSNIYITNTVKCRPPQNRDPAPDEVQACSGFLHAQIAALRPKAILTLGRFASAWLMGGEVVMGDIHGRTFSYHGTPWIPTYHPSAVLRNADLKRPVWEDLKGFKDICSR